MLLQENKIVFLKGHGERTHTRYALLQLFCKKKGSHHNHELFRIMPELLRAFILYEYPVQAFSPTPCRILKVLYPTALLLQIY